MLYFVYDVRGIKKFIFESLEFKAVIGASELLRKFDEELREKLKGKVDFYGGGGTGFGKLKDPSYKNEVESIFKDLVKEKLLGHTVIYDFVDENSFEDKEFQGKLQSAAKLGNFGKTMSKLFFALNLKKTRFDTYKDSIGIIAQIPKDKLCPSCMKREKISDYCEVCSKKIEMGKETKNDSVKFTPNLTDISECIKGQSKGYIAVFYADGNSLGDIYLSFDRIEDYEKFTRELSTAIEDARVSLPQKVYGGKECIVASPLTGGDDLMLFVSPSKLIPLIEEFVNFMDKRLENIGSSRKITFSIGAVILPAETPLNLIFEAVEELQDKAKESHQKALEDGTKEEDHYIALRYLTESSFTPHIEEDYPSAKIVYGKGISYKEFEMVKNIAENYAKAGLKSKINTIKDMIRSSDSASELEISTIYFLGRAEGSGGSAGKDSFKEAAEFYKNIINKDMFGVFYDIYSVLSNEWEVKKCQNQS